MSPTSITCLRLCLGLGKVLCSCLGMGVWAPSMGPFSLILMSVYIHYSLDPENRQGPIVWTLDLVDRL